MSKQNCPARKNTTQKGRKNSRDELARPSEKFPNSPQTREKKKNDNLTTLKINMEHHKKKKKKKKKSTQRVLTG